MIATASAQAVHTNYLYHGCATTNTAASKLQVSKYWIRFLSVIIYYLNILVKFIDNDLANFPF